jgi:putative membrane protein
MRFFPKPERFWSEIFQFQGSAAPYVAGRTLVFGLIALVITVMEKNPSFPPVGIPLAPYEILGAALGALLVLRTNAGYERWWQGRTLWGGMVNECRNLVIQGLSYGPNDPEWRRRLVSWTAAYPHIARRSLRGQRGLPELEPLVGADEAARIASVDHMPSAVALVLGSLLREALEKGMEPLAFAQAEQQRCLLIDQLGACEKILKTPLPLAYSVQIREFIFVFLVALPFGIVLKADWLTPVVTMLVGFPILALDEIGVELQNPFSTARLNHLPLDEICEMIERNTMSLLGSQSAASPGGREETPASAGPSASTRRQS